MLLLGFGHRLIPIAGRKPLHAEILLVPRRVR